MSHLRTPTPFAAAEDGRPTGEGFDADGNCMICSGDCAGANPPVMNCPYDRRATRSMTIEEACHSILGDETASGIIAGQSVYWCVVAAMGAATTADDPVAIATIRAWNAEQKARQQ